LPGLIILLQDEKDNYNFSFVKNVNLKETYDTSNFLEVRYGNKPIPVSEKIFVNKKMEYFNDPITLNQNWKAEQLTVWILTE
jgi:GLPGLI family protein